MAELEQLATHESPVVRGLYDVFTNDMQEDPELKTEVWDVMFAPKMEDNPNVLSTHILSVAGLIGKIAARGAVPNYTALAHMHAEVQPLPDGTMGRMTDRQFDLTVGAIAGRLTEQGLQDEVAEVVRKLPEIKAAIVEGVVPTLPPAA